MRWRLLGPLLGLILLGAVIFSMWPAAAPVIPPPDPVALPALPLAVAPAPLERPEPAKPMPQVAPPAVVPPPPGPALTPQEQLDPEAELEHLRALGLSEADLEPIDGGPLFALTRDGIKAAVTAGLPEIRECYDGWLQHNPSLGGKLKVRFDILEIPGRERAKVMRVEIADGGLGHVAMEGCVRNVFKTMRFEAPPGGELRVNYPLVFEPKQK